MAMLDDIFLDELVDDPEPMLVEEPQAVEENEDESEQPPLNPSGPSEGAVRVAPKKSGIKRQYVLLNPQKVTGPRGITCIEKYFKDVKLRGKGHELSDLNTVMSHLEHWANRMYPRSKFDDVLKRLEVLGHKRPVMTQVKKIRLGMIQDMEHDSNLVLSDTENTETSAQPPTADDIFNELLATQPTQQINTVKEITEAQRERMLQNRRLAEEKRQARLAAEAERRKRDEANARTLQGIEFQTALLETQGSERETILARGELVEPSPVSESQDILDASVEVVRESQANENQDILDASVKVIRESQANESQDILDATVEVVKQKENQASEGQDMLDAFVVEGLDLDEWEMSEKVDESKELSKKSDETKKSSNKTIVDKESSKKLNETKEVTDASKGFADNLNETEPVKVLNGSKEANETKESQVANNTDGDFLVSESLDDKMEMSF